MHLRIRDLLRFSQAGNASDPSEPADTQQVLDTVLDDLRTCIEEHGAVIEYDRLPPVMVHATELMEIFQNLLENAIRYRGDEPPRLQVGARVEGDTATFSVSDNGAGIEERYFDKIFEVFQRIENSNSRGTGIGLAIVKRVVERRGGRIWLESTPGCGSTFYFTLPRCIQDSEKAEELPDR
jgi:light-regulated signal transduction histidine kinase (bacteriophytochrome)